MIIVIIENTAWIITNLRNTSRHHHPGFMGLTTHLKAPLERSHSVVVQEQFTISWSFVRHVPQSAPGDLQDVVVIRLQQLVVNHV